MLAFIWLINTVFSLVWWMILASVVLSWLLAFGIINPSNRFVRQVIHGLNSMTDPLLNPIRRILPAMGGLDLSPVILLIGMEFARQLLINFLVTLV